jgi:hypothetical protein
MVLTLVGVLAGSLPAGARSYTPPGTPQARALDRILHQADTDDDGRIAMLKGRASDYDRSLSPALISALRRAERSRARPSCGPDQECYTVQGFDQNEITCASQAPASRVYRTEGSGAGGAVIAVRWSKPTGRKQGDYRMVLRDGAWRLDAIRCANGERRNWP